MTTALYCLIRLFKLEPSKLEYYYKVVQQWLTDDRNNVFLHTKYLKTNQNNVSEDPSYKVLLLDFDE